MVNLPLRCMKGAAYTLLALFTLKPMETINYEEEVRRIPVWRKEPNNAQKWLMETTINFVEESTKLKGRGAQNESIIDLSVG